MPDFKEAQNALLRTLSCHVSRLGFRPKAGSQSFYRNEQFGRWALHLSFIPHKTDFDVTADVAVRIDEIEEIVNQFAVDLSERDKRSTFTLGAELGNITEGQPHRWNISGEADVAPAAQAIAVAFEGIGMPYLVSLSGVESAYRLLASPNSREWLSCPIAGARCLRAVAAAHILGRQEDLASLIQRCDGLLSSQHDPYLTEFRNLAGTVMARS